MSVLIIAEAGVNHGGSIATALRLVDIAADAGADVVKFQTFRADELVTPAAPKADYQRATTDGKESQHEMIRKLELSPEMHHALIDHCRTRGIGFFSTAFDIASLMFLAGLGFKRFKVPSGEITNFPYLQCVGVFGKPILLSTGMATLEEIHEAIRVLEGAGTPRSNITVLHCNTEYPTPMEDVNLLAMLEIGRACNVAVGYSDHTMGIEVSIAAVALGATVIEKHITLDRSAIGPDHAASLEPDELRIMVRAIRSIERALGDGHKRPTPSEVKNRAVARKSLVAARAIRAGETLTEANVGVKRPGTGVSPMRWNEAIGRAAVRDFAKDELLEL
jgi:N,N'-diacetyllegionaminate synthase